MRSFKIPLFITLIVSLGFGIGLGIKLKRDRAAQLGVVTGSRKLKVLSLTGALPSEILRHFASAENIQVELAEEETPDAVFKRLEASVDFDVVTVLTTQVSKAFQALKLQPIKTSNLAGFSSASRDFVDVPGHAADVVPFLWGILNLEKVDAADLPPNIRTLTLADLSTTSQRTFKTGESRGPGLVWVLNFAMVAGAKNQDEARAFFTFMLKPDVATELSKSTHQSSTNLGVDQSQVDERLKPQSLRRIPLTGLQLVFDEPAVEKPAPKAIESPVPKLALKPAKKVIAKPSLRPPVEQSDESDSEPEIEN